MAGIGGERMKEYSIDVTKAIQEGKELPYCLIYSISSVYLGRTKENVEVDEEIIEAHFFDEDKEIRITRNQGIFIAAKLESSPEDDYIERVYHVKRAKGKLIVHEEIDYDSDGQAYVADIRLIGWRGEENI